MKNKNIEIQVSFRPLSRQIGIYTATHKDTEGNELVFPSPLEVDKYLYDSPTHPIEEAVITFPAPREVDRQLYDVQ